MANDDVTSTEKVSDSTKGVIALIDSAIFKILGKVISIIVVPIGLFFLYHAWDALDQHGKDLAGIAVTLNDIKGQVAELKNGFSAQIGQLAQDEHNDQTDIAVLKSEVERPGTPLEQVPQTYPEEHHFRRQQPQPDNPIKALGNTLEKVFKPVGKVLKEVQPQHGTVR